MSERPEDAEDRMKLNVPPEDWWKRDEMSEKDWTPRKPEGLVGLKAEEYERLKADSKRLDYFIAVRLRRSSLKMDGTSLYTMHGFRGPGDFRLALDGEIKKEVEWSEADKLLDDSFKELSHE